jgi:hypothetical protein
MIVLASILYTVYTKKMDSRDNSFDTLSAHEADFRPDAWQEYTVDELLAWVRLLTKRAGMRADEAKREKDLSDAANYRAMLLKKIETWD